MSATTHIDLVLRAKERGIKVQIVNNASVISAVGITGLEVYKFGRITSIPFHNERVVAPLSVLKENQKMGLHTLFLLDLDPEKKRFMSVNEALEYLLRIGLDKEMICVGCAQLGSEEPVIKVGSAERLLKEEFAKYPQCLIIPGKLHFIEEESLERFGV